MNKFELVGRLTQDVISKQSASGKDYAYINIAVSRRGNGTDFIDITVFDATARFAAKYFRRGSWVSVVGRIDASTYEKDGMKVYDLRLVGDELGFCGYNKGGDAPQGINASAVDSNDFAFAETITATDDNLPF